MGRLEAGAATVEPTSVVVTAPARLHLGFLDLEGGLGRRFGSIGLTLEGLHTRLRLKRAATTTITGVGELDRARSLLATLAESWRLPPVRIDIETAIPAHGGLGSGTQLALALGVGLARLSGQGAAARDVARLLDRGSRSGIGIGAFTDGGFLLDGGRAEDGEPPPIISRLPVPEAWRVLLIFDGERQGLHGTSETGAFRSLPPYAPELAAHLCRLVVMRLLPGLATADLEAAGTAIGEIQRRVGDYFAPAQGGRFTSPAVSEVLAWLESQGVRGIGQSSWGPTGFAILGSTGQAGAVDGELRRVFADRHPALRFLVTGARNHGAEIVAM